MNTEALKSPLDETRAPATRLRDVNAMFSGTFALVSGELTHGFGSSCLKMSDTHSDVLSGDMTQAFGSSCL